MLGKRLLRIALIIVTAVSHRTARRNHKPVSAPPATADFNPSLSTPKPQSLKSANSALPREVAIPLICGRITP